MRLRKNHSDAGQPNGESRRSKRREGRGWGPFSGGQLTIVIVAIAAMFAIPTAALAAGGAFSNNSATVPAVKATNANAHGIGVQGTGKKFGVLSNGPLGVAAGKSLSCIGCVAPAALSIGAKSVQPLGHGQAESGSWALYNNDASAIAFAAEGVTFVRPVAGSLGLVDVAGVGPVTHCPGPGQADPGYVCFYESQFNANATGGAGLYHDIAGGMNVGAEIYDHGAAAGTFYEGGIYTVKAP
jgi:hypothetical protein